MKIEQNNMTPLFLKYKQEFEDAALNVLRSGWYVLGKNVQLFEKEFANFVGAKYCVGLASGLDALWIAIRALNIGVGDEVIVQANTYIASVMGITVNGAKPVFVEPNDYYNIDSSRIEKAISKHTKAVLVVHLYGQATNMDEICDICQRHGLYLIEDCAQAHGAKYKDKCVGTFGDVGCFSFYPTKNVGAFGDAGAIVTNNEKIDEYVRTFRNYGSEKRYYNKIIGANSRLDEIQAALLRVKLKHVDEITYEHTKIAEKYDCMINNEKIIKPKVHSEATSVWHQYVVRCEKRENLMKFLESKEISTIIHYPIPPYLSEAYEYLNITSNDFPITKRYADTVLSLPMYFGMSEEQQSYVVDVINSFNG